MAEVDFLAFFVIFVHREIDDPAEFERVFFDDVHVLRDFGARLPGHFRGFERFVADEETESPSSQPVNWRKFELALRHDETRDGAFASARFERDVAEARRAVLWPNR